MVEWEVLWCVVEADADQHLSRRRSQLSLPRSRVGLTFAGLMEEWDSDRVQSAGVSVRCTAASLSAFLTARCGRCALDDKTTWETTGTSSSLALLREGVIPRYYTERRSPRVHARRSLDVAFFLLAAWRNNDEFELTTTSYYTSTSQEVAATVKPSVDV